MMTDEKGSPLILSATVILGRDGKEGLEVFMVKRNREMDFASGVLVFPGGKVDALDRNPELLNYCDSRERLTERERVLHVAAIRETFEESGIFFARHRETQTMISGESLKRLSFYRKPLAEREISLATLIEKERLRLACDSLVTFASWVTPKEMPRRFDTAFFLAEAPQDHDGVHDGFESVDSLWTTPLKAVQMAEAGQCSIIFPTRMNLLKLARSQTLKEALQAARTQAVRAITPWVENRGGELMLCIPEDQGYPVTSEPLNKVMGEAASR